MAGKGIVITGEGIVSAIGNDKKSVRTAIGGSRTGIGEMRYLQSEHHELPVGEVKLSDDEMKRLLDIPADRTVSRTTLLGIMAVREALRQSGVEKGASRRIILISGTTVAGMDVTEKNFGKMLAAAGDKQESCDLSWLGHHDCGSCTEDIAHYFGIFDDFTTTSTACSSAANAIILGADMLKAGDADIVVAGGTEALSRFHLDGFNSLMILDHDICRPFDSSRNGLNLGEGAAYVVMEREDEARERGATIDAWLSGYGNACDAYHQTASSPEDTGAQMAMREALAMAGMKSVDIQWVHAHGTGTQNNDSSEVVAIDRVFGDTTPLVTSTKGFTGHTTSASGAIAAVISILAMHDGFVPVSLGTENPISKAIPTAQSPIKTELQNVMVNSFGFGGNDSSLILSASDNGCQREEFTGNIGVEEVARVENNSVENLKDIKRYVSAMEARRMGKLLKSALMTSLRALETAAVSPDAIVTATAHGSLEYSERLLTAMATGDAFKPTYFMQSTHNTTGSTIAIHLKCHGYNTTISQGQQSMQWALYQAELLIRSGRCKTVLVGCHDEMAPLFAKFMSMAEFAPEPEVASTAIVLRAVKK